jgi:branched-chain amino acid transport system ATP-binding protein
MIRRGIVFMPQKKNVFEDFTVEENLLTSASIYSKKEMENRIEIVYETIPQLAKIRKRTPFHMSGGEKQLLAFSNVLVHSPKLILLDEPFAGVDIANSEILCNRIDYLNKTNTTFLIIDHKKSILNNLNYRELELELGMIKR